ncbi:hypothetical protein [Cysteiniphilum sp. JM-1]|uniref:hypothetical protein n=1 Tax=Cysteiniphilum sp. JM-1 TaxID=2610891 RepID=UPI0012454D6C|nr:hypothetical protein [Cysteiniphilum sp. JM-1]
MAREINNLSKLFGLIKDEKVKDSTNTLYPILYGILIEYQRLSVEAQTNGGKILKERMEGIAEVFTQICEKNNLDIGVRNDSQYEDPIISDDISEYVDRQKGSQSNSEDINILNSSSEKSVRTEQEEHIITNPIITDLVRQLRLKRGQTRQENYNTTAYANLKDAIIDHQVEQAIASLPKLESKDLPEDQELMDTLKAQYQRIARSYFEQINVEDSGNAKARLLKMSALRGMMESISNHQKLNPKDIKIISLSHTDIKSSFENLNIISENDSKEYISEDDNNETLPIPKLPSTNKSYTALHPLLISYQQRDQKFYDYKKELLKQLNERNDQDSRELTTQRDDLSEKVKSLENDIKTEQKNLDNLENSYNDYKEILELLNEDGSIRSDVKSTDKIRKLDNLMTRYNSDNTNTLKQSIKDKISLGINSESKDIYINNLPTIIDDCKHNLSQKEVDCNSIKLQLEGVEEKINNKKNDVLIFKKVSENQPVNIDNCSEANKENATNYNTSLPVVKKAIDELEKQKQRIKDNSGITRVEKLNDLLEKINSNSLELTGRSFDTIVDTFKLNDKRSHWSMNNTTTYNNLKKPLQDYIKNSTKENKDALYDAINNDIERLKGIANDKDVNFGECETYKNALEKIKAVDKLISGIKNGQEVNTTDIYKHRSTSSFVNWGKTTTEKNASESIKNYLSSLEELSKGSEIV